MEGGLDRALCVGSHEQTPLDGQKDQLVKCAFELMGFNGEPHHVICKGLIFSLSYIEQVHKGATNFGFLKKKSIKE